jgi:hypothetical protein
MEAAVVEEAPPEEKAPAPAKPSWRDKLKRKEQAPPEAPKESAKKTTAPAHRVNQQEIKDIMDKYGLDEKQMEGLVSYAQEKGLALQQVIDEIQPPK